MQQLPKNTFLQGGKYKIEKVLGQGGFGITYLATQELLDRKVCIKEFFFKDSCSRNAGGEVTLGTSGNRDLVERFLNKFIKEARTLSQLDHPNIIRILDIFKENGTAYYVMDYIEGSSLEDIVNSRGALSESEAITYIKQVANALDYIHQRSINHLDVKPANIMVRRSDNKAILIDFGVSKQYDSQGEQTSTTPVGISYGYAPIEQYRPGGVITFSPQADIYALGATLYKLVTGNIPPQAIEIFNEGSLRLPQSLSSNISNAIQNAMELKKSDRPTSVEEFLSALNVFYTNQKEFSLSTPKSTVSEPTIQMTSMAHFNKDKFVKLVAGVLGINPSEVVDNASFKNDLGADSLDVVEIIMHIEQEFGILIDDDFIFIGDNQNDKITVGDAVSFLEKAVLMKSNRLLSRKEILNNINVSNTDQKESSFTASKSSINEATIQIEPIKPKNEVNGHEYVDLGLPSGLKWATCNVGANKPEEYGDYFAWGEIKTKLEYREDNYDYNTIKNNFFGIKKVYNYIGNNISGTQYDVARARWGGSWRIPTITEWEELKNKCVWTWVPIVGCSGCKITGPNGNSIFLPDAGCRFGSSFGGGYGHYWSSLPHTKYNDYACDFELSYAQDYYKVGKSSRWYGLTVRPVTN